MWKLRPLSYICKGQKPLAITLTFKKIRVHTKYPHYICALVWLVLIVWPVRLGLFPSTCTNHRHFWLWTRFAQMYGTKPDPSQWVITYVGAVLICLDLAKLKRILFRVLISAGIERILATRRRQLWGFSEKKHWRTLETQISSAPSVHSPQTLAVPDIFRYNSLKY